VSRRFVALSQRRLKECLSRPLGELDLWVVMIDGIAFLDHTILVALGIDGSGSKHVLGLREGTTENAAVASALLSDLVDRGLPADRPLLFVIDGAKALRKAIGRVFGESVAVQRCQVHKIRNVLAHLPEELHPTVRHAMQQAYNTTKPASARRQLERLARSLEDEHPGAAASLCEGLEETLTLQALGISSALWRTLRSTNPIENLNGAVGKFTRNVRSLAGWIDDPSLGRIGDPRSRGKVPPYSWSPRDEESHSVVALSRQQQQGGEQRREGRVIQCASTESSASSQISSGWDIPHPCS
jgi:transposase-like protein